MKTSKDLFSSRVENYIRYRPTYPEAVVNTLIEECQLDGNSKIADIGSGTGIFTHHLLEKGFNVFAIEPNQEMRYAAEVLLSGYDRFTSVNGSAEATNLANSSADLIVAAQAFHWFHYKETQLEFSRILKPPGWLALIWNQRKIQQPFQQDYEALLYNNVPQYKPADHMNIADDVIAGFMVPESYQKFTFENSQILDEKGFLGRIQSATYTPSIDTPEYSKLMAAAGLLFSEYEINGKVTFEYDTRLYIGRIKYSEQMY